MNDLDQLSQDELNNSSPETRSDSDSKSGDSFMVVFGILLTVVAFLVIAVLLGVGWLVWVGQWVEDEPRVEDEVGAVGEEMVEDEVGVVGEGVGDLEKAETFEENIRREELVSEREIIIEQTGDFERLVFSFPDDLKIDNRIGDWRVVGVGTFSRHLRPLSSRLRQNKYSEENFDVDFLGSVEMRGLLVRYDESQIALGPFIDVVCFEPDDNGLASLPALESSGGGGSFCFSDQEEAKQYIRPGEKMGADIVISDYYYFIYPTTGAHGAKLKEIKALYPNYQIVK